MTSDQASRIVAILQANKGDDLYRARKAFEGQNLDELYGESCLTRRQILAGYQAHETEMDELIACITPPLPQANPRNHNWAIFDVRGCQSRMMRIQSQGLVDATLPNKVLRSLKLLERALLSVKP